MYMIYAYYVNDTCIEIMWICMCIYTYIYLIYIIFVQELYDIYVYDSDVQDMCARGMMCVWYVCDIYTCLYMYIHDTCINCAYTMCI